MKNNFNATSNANMSANNAKAGIKKFGFVTNLRTCLSELNEILPVEQQISCRELNQIAEQAKVTYLNKYGYAQKKDGSPVDEEEALVLYFEMGLNNTQGEPVIGVFERKTLTNAFTGVRWTTEAALKGKVGLQRKFRIGELVFDKEADGIAFLEDVAASAIQEKWSFQHRQSAFNHPILKSYIENILEVLRHESEKGATDKLVCSKDGKHMAFNINLLDRYFHDVIIVAEVRQVKGGATYLANAKRVGNPSDLMKMGFSLKSLPAQPSFFEKVEEVIFQPSWTILKDFDKFEHIIDERRMRFPEDLRSLPSEMLAQKLENAIAFAVAIAQRNYKFIVPMYRPQTGRIQLLMPIYLNGSYSCKPDFALILTPDRDNECYTPETILPLDAVYQNARLIAKPDDTWLNPDTIL